MKMTYIGKKKTEKKSHKIIKISVKVSIYNKLFELNFPLLRRCKGNNNFH